MSGFNIACWTLNIFAPVEEVPSAAYPHGQSDKRVLANLPAMLEAVEEDLTDLLPAGYTARLTPWEGS